MAYNVLIVDDSATMRLLIRKVLTISGFAIHSFFEGSNGRDALNILEANRADVILCDLYMPEMDGAAFLQTLRTHKLWRTIPVVLITSESRQEVVGPLLEGGVQGYIKKPFHLETLRDQLMDILGEVAGANVREFEGCDF